MISMFNIIYLLAHNRSLHAGLLLLTLSLYQYGVVLLVWLMSTFFLSCLCIIFTFLYFYYCVLILTLQLITFYIFVTFTFLYWYFLLVLFHLGIHFVNNIITQRLLWFNYAFLVLLLLHFTLGVPHLFCAFILTNSFDYQCNDTQTLAWAI